MRRLLLALSLSLLASSALAAQATLPAVKDSAGNQVSAGAVILVDTSGNPVAGVGPAVALGAATPANSLPVVLPLSTQETVSATGTTAAVTATLAAASGKTTYICGFTIGSGATTALDGSATVTGVVTATMSFLQDVGTVTAAQNLIENFSPCLPASASNTTISVVSVAAGSGGVTDVSAWGYQQ